MEPAIQVTALHKSYDKFEAVRGIDFEVRPGEIFGLLGPNGAGKTTTVEILEGLRPRTSGTVRVLGQDPGIDVRALKDRIGVCLQATNLPDKLKVHEALSWFSAFYTQHADCDQLLKRLQLWEKRNDYYSKLSGGQKQRVALALALVNNPDLIFLDEPTTGLDPQVRLEIHTLIEEFRSAKRTILLTTHYIEEAERLCDRVAIIDQGRIIAMGSPREIQQQTLGQSRIEVLTTQPMPAEVPQFRDSEKHVRRDDGKLLTVYSARPARTLTDLVLWIEKMGLELEDIHLKRPTLEDVFIELTGKETQGLMQAYIAQIRMTLRLVFRNRAALIFGYGFPLVFFFLFSGLFGAGGSGTMAGQVVSMVLTIGVLGSGFFGAGLQAVQNREQNILRRFKVAPITPAPMLVSAIVASLVSYMPMSVLIVGLAHRFYGMPWPQNWPSLFLFIAIGVVTFCTIGNIVAAVVNSMQEAQLLTNLLYMPMLMLGGAAIPLTIMPKWVQMIAQFLPSSYFMTGVQSILGGRTTFIGNLGGVGALVLTSAVGTLLGIKLFRWEKEEKLRASAKLWLVGVLAPFIVLGVYQAYAKGNINQVKLLARDVSRSRSWLIHDARIFVGDGTVIEQGSVLIRNGKITQVYGGSAPDAKSLNADVIEGAGKTLLPGLIDMHVHLGAPGITGEREAGQPDDNTDRELAAYLYSGVTAVKSMGDGIDSMLQHRATISSGDKLGAEMFIVGPMFTTDGGHGTEFLSYVPQQYREQASAQTIRIPKTPDEARAQVAELKMKGVDGIKAILDAGGGSTHFNRMDTAILKSLTDAAHAANLPIMVHTGSAQDVADAIAAGVDGVEHGAMRDTIPPELVIKLHDKGISYDPTLVALETIQAFIDGNTSVLDRSLVQQIVPANILAQAKKGMTSSGASAARNLLRGYPFRLDLAGQNLAAANRAGVTLIVGTDSGNPMLVHGPALHRELQLWVKAGVPSAVALQAATYNAARMLKADSRIGLVKEGREANLLLVDGNPLEDISATERISTILFKGERVNRAGLFDQK